MRRFRIAGLALLALAVPPFALGGEEAPSGPAELSVSASLAGCGLAQQVIVCQIDAGWTPLEGADYYTVSVTRPDGSVVDAGQAAGAGRSIFVPYVGSGTYAVEVSAWGTPPGEEGPEVLVREKTLSTPSDAGGGAMTQPGDAGLSADDRDAADPGAVTDEPGTTDPVVDEPLVCEVPDDEEPADEPSPAEEGDPAAETSTDELAAVADAPDAEEPAVPPVCP